MRETTFYQDNLILYIDMLRDIEQAKRYVYLETYMFNADNIGKKFVTALIRKAKENLDVRVIVDDIGSNSNRQFFSALTAAGGHVRFFRKIRVSWLLKKNNQRDHRKVLVIDDLISYIGSSNISDSALTWRESNLRIKNGCGVHIRNAFLENFNIAKNIFFKRKTHLEPYGCSDYEIIRDIPSLRHRTIRKKINALISKASKEVLIETPYFLPDRKLRKALKTAAKRGASVTIMLPKISDVKIVDILRTRYLGKLHKAGIRFIFYTPAILHSKTLVVDERIYGIGSHNLDYRSDILHFEIMVFGNKSQVTGQIKKGFISGTNDSEPFDYARWRQRGWTQRILERLLIPIRYWF